MKPTNYFNNKIKSWSQLPGLNLTLLPCFLAFHKYLLCIYYVPGTALSAEARGTN